MKKNTTYMARLVNGRLIKTKTISKLRRLGPAIKVWKLTITKSVDLMQSWSQQKDIANLLRL